MEVSFVLPEAVMMIYGLSVIMVTLFAVFYFVMRRSISRLSERLDLHASAISTCKHMLDDMAAPKRKAPAKKKAPAKRAKKTVQSAPAQPANGLGTSLHQRLSDAADDSYSAMVVEPEDLR